MHPFKIDELRELLLGSCGYRLNLNASRPEAVVEHALASFGHFFVECSVQCLITGLNDPALQLFHKAKEWLELSIERNEIPLRHYYPNGTEAEKHVDLALANWLLQNEHDSINLHKYVEFQNLYTDSSATWKDKVAVDLTVVGYLDAKAYDDCLALIARTRGFEPPWDLTKCRREIAMAYVLCRHRLGIDYESHEVAEASERFLRRNVKIWLGEGDAARVAQWMKIIHWDPNPGRKSAKDTVLAALRYLPSSVDKP